MSEEPEVRDARPSFRLLQHVAPLEFTLRPSQGVIQGTCVKELTAARQERWMYKMKQTSSFDEHLDQHRALRLANYLREHHDDLVSSLSDEDLVQHVHYGIRRASAYGIDVDRSLTMFLLLMLRTSQTFDEHPSIQRLLTDVRIKPNLRIYEVVYRATNEDWEQIMARERTRWN